MNRLSVITLVGSLLFAAIAWGWNSKKPLQEDPLPFSVFKDFMTQCTDKASIRFARVNDADSNEAGVVFTCTMRVDHKLPQAGTF